MSTKPTAVDTGRPVSGANLPKPKRYRTSTELIHVGRPNIGDQRRYFELLQDMLDRKWLSNDGPMVVEFEKRLAEYLGVKNCVVVCNATIGLEIAARALGLSGEVIVPSFTFVATAHALAWQGITPVFADIDQRTHCLDPDAVAKLITLKTTGIIATHIWGMPAAVDGLQRLSEEHGLALMFDAAHAFGCSYSGKLIGNFGRCEVFSFHATKFLNSLEGGAITTNDDELAAVCRKMRNFGFSGYDSVVSVGTNGKMTEACAAMGIVNLDSLELFIETNKRNYEAYRGNLRDIECIRTFAFDLNDRNNFQYMVIEVQPESRCSRDQVVAALHAENVLARKYFWPGCHRMNPYCETTAAFDLPNTEAVASRVVVLPTGTSVTLEDIGQICAIIRARVT